MISFHTRENNLLIFNYNICRLILNFISSIGMIVAKSRFEIMDAIMEPISQLPPLPKELTGAKGPTSAELPEGTFSLILKESCSLSQTANADQDAKPVEVSGKAVLQLSDVQSEDNNPNREYAETLTGGAILPMVQSW
jgi:hypothetical protein